MKISKRKTATTNAKIVVASVLLSLPIAQNSLDAQNKAQENIGIKSGSQSTSREKMHMKFSSNEKFKGELSIVGIDKGIPVYKNGRGEYFSIDPATGDMKFISAEMFSKYMCCIKMGDRSSSKISMHKYAEKSFQTVTFAGVDDKGNVIHTNKRGEKFYLDSYTGDMIYVK
ncbi:MAG: hypothetical protein IPM69_04920 [Ignavibacteria bacterium]|nr:hypothetical protein [Ignavibacteria bacterium]